MVRIVEDARWKAAGPGSARRGRCSEFAATCDGGVTTREAKSWYRCIHDGFSGGVRRGRFQVSCRWFSHVFRPCHECLSTNATDSPTVVAGWEWISVVLWTSACRFQSSGLPGSGSHGRSPWDPFVSTNQAVGSISATKTEYFGQVHGLRSSRSAWRKSFTFLVTRIMRRWSAVAAISESIADMGVAAVCSLAVNRPTPAG